MEHSAIWEALATHGVNPGYIEILKRLYIEQSGQVRANKRLSRTFQIERGTKQGDSLSSLLFNAVLENCFADVRDKWRQKKYGLEMSIGTDCYLRSLCFADDVMLFASTRAHLQNMLIDFKNAAEARGLILHPEKSKVMTNAFSTTQSRVPQRIHIGDESLEVLDLDAKMKWLGRKISFNDPQDCELNNRIAAAWGAFSKHKAELTGKQYRLCDRMRLFSAVVTSTALYGCETWTL